MQQLSPALAAIAAQPVPPTPPAAEANPDLLITACMLEVQRVITRIARSRGPMPNNPLLGRLAGGRGRSSALRALRRLERAGELRMEVRDKRRRCFVTATNSWTDWGVARPGHAPFLHRRRGEAADPNPLPDRAPASRPMAVRAQSLSPALPLPGMDYRLMGEIACYAETCQFLFEPTGARRAKARFCEALSCSGVSYCAEHAAVVYPNRKVTSVPAKAARRGMTADLVVLHDMEAGQDVAGDRLYSTEALFGLLPE